MIIDEDKRPRATAGDSILCHRCGLPHVLRDSVPKVLLYYVCEGRTYLAGVGGRLTVDQTEVGE